MTENDTLQPNAPDTIVLVHGFWVTPLSWEKWVERYEDRGYRVLTPTYPGFEGGVEALREDPSPIEALTFPAIVEHIGGIIDELDAPPSSSDTPPAGCSPRYCSITVTAQRAWP
jgi:pimeloyl-ACP methyl ester carboxylesterase